MKTLNIEFAPKRQKPIDRILLLLLSVCCILTVLGVVLGFQAERQAQDQLAQAQEIQVRQTDASELAFQGEQVAPDVVSAVNTAVDMLNYPLLDILTVLEKHTHPGVSVISAELGPTRSSARIVVLANSPLDVLDYLDEIKTEAGFQNIALTRQENAGGNDAQTNWRFTLELPQVPNMAQGVSVSSTENLR